MILNRQRTVRIPRTALESFLRRIRRHLRLGKAELNVAFVTDAAIARMNQTYRKKRGPTDVLSFPSVQRRRPVPVPIRSRTAHVAAAFRGGRRPAARAFNANTNANSLGDIAISPATARRNAKKFGRSLPDELRILMLHGVLHLLGYDHETDSGHMDCLEQNLRRRLGLA
jgi:probable rRNA maturation factor